MFIHSAQKNQSGAVILEFALIAGIFIFTILAIMDLSRYFAAQALLTKGAQNGLAVAKTDPDFDIDVQRLSTECPLLAGGATDTACQTKMREAFKAARDRVITAATDLPLATLISQPGSGGSIALKTFNNLDSLMPGMTTETDQFALVLRPGDAAQQVRKESSTVSITEETRYHPQICPPNSNPTSPTDPCRTSADPTMQSTMRKRETNEPLTRLFENYPIVVETTAEVKMLLPFFGPLTVTGTAVGYREVVNRSKVGQIPDQMACPITAADCACGAEFETVDGNCQCQPLASACATQHWKFGVFNKDSCSCDCSTPAAARTDSNVPGSACANKEGGNYYKPAGSGVPVALWSEETCSCECNDAACPDGATVTLPGGGTAVVKPGGAGATAAGCYCGCTATSGPSGPNNNQNPCQGGFTFETNRCGCTCWSGEKAHCDRAMAQNPGKYVWNQSMCQCQCAPGNPDSSCQPISCFVNNKVAQAPLAAACDAQGRKFDYTNCTCSNSCRSDAGMAACPGGQTRQFDGTNCSCSCPTAPQTCNPGSYWNATSCACQACSVTCGPLQALDPATCTCISSGGG